MRIPACRSCFLIWLFRRISLLLLPERAAIIKTEIRVRRESAGKVKDKKDACDEKLCLFCLNRSVRTAWNFLFLDLNQGIKCREQYNESVEQEVHMEGWIHSVESFGSVDGPGVRFVIFVQGCPFRCLYCHNADTWKMAEGKRMDSDVLLEKALRYRSYWGSEGGITVSGGEPLMQVEFLTDLFTKAKKLGVSTCIDTAMGPYREEKEWKEKFDRLMEVTDLLLVDIKEIDRDKHKALTGQDNFSVMKGLRYLSSIDKPVWIRHVLVPGVTDNDQDLKRTRSFIDSLSNVERVEVLPYHSLGAYKWEKQGMKYPLDGVKSPDQRRIENAERILCRKEKA